MKEKDFPLMNRNKILKNKRHLSGVFSGVYFLINEDEIVYIGGSYCIPARIDTHRKCGEKRFTHYSFEFVPDPFELMILERLYIKKYKPKYNKEDWSNSDIKNWQKYGGFGHSHDIRRAKRLNKSKDFIKEQTLLINEFYA